MTDAEVERLLEMCAAATPEPWSIGAAGPANIVHYNGDDITGVARAWNPNNIGFICAARTALPQLLSERAMLIEALERARLRLPRSPARRLGLDEKDIATHNNAIDAVLAQVRGVEGA